jgi:predicted dehydrogenase
LLADEKVYEKKSARIVRMGIVGGNFGSSFYWHEHPNSKVTAVCDIRDDRLERLQKVYRCPTGYKNYKDLVADKNVDAVGIFTPWDLHVDQAVEAMKAGKHVISAVPAGISIESCEHLLHWAEKTGLIYMMAETSYYRPQIMTCRRWAREGKCGTIFYAEGEYCHDGIEALWYDRDGRPTWRLSRPPLWYITHATGCVIPVMGERLTEVVGMGYGDMNHPGILGRGLKTNRYANPFWNGVALFKTSGGHSCRIAVFRHVAARGAERAQFFGTEMSFYMELPGISEGDFRAVRQKTGRINVRNNYPETVIKAESYEVPNYWELLPPELRHRSGHGGSHTFLTHEFVSAVAESRKPAIDIYEALAYTAPGQYAHQSALEGGTLKKIKNYDKV